jgi:hypothetical protein
MFSGLCLKADARGGEILGCHRSLSCPP